MDADDADAASGRAASAAQGVLGPIGPSNAYTLLKHTTFGLTESPQDTYVDIAKIENLPAGRYVATASLTALKRGGGTLIRCQIVAPAHHSPRRAVSAGETAGSAFASTITVSMPVQLNSAFTLTLQCLTQYTNEPEKATDVENVEMQALKVGNLDARHWAYDRAHGRAHPRPPRQAERLHAGGGADAARVRD